MRKFIIDADTASDDIVAIIIALREKSIKVCGITVVAGNVDINRALENTFIAIKVANTYTPPVYKGMCKPLIRERIDAKNVHGSDGIGDMNLPSSNMLPEKDHAVEALINIIEENPYEIELVTLGPLTNIAMACLEAPETMKKLKSITLMASAGFGPGNTTKNAEFNAYADAEALNIVLQLDVPKLLVGWDIIKIKSVMDEDDINKLKKSNSFTSKFVLRATKSLCDFSSTPEKRMFTLPDPMAIVVAIWPNVIEKKVNVYAFVITESGDDYGKVILVVNENDNKKNNATICIDVNEKLFKEHVFEKLTYDPIEMDKKEV